MRKIAFILFTFFLIQTMGVGAETISLPETFALPTGGVYQQGVLAEEELPTRNYRLSSGTKTLFETLRDGCLAQAEYIDILSYGLTWEEFADAYYNFAMLYPECLVFTGYRYSILNDVVEAVAPTYLFPDKGQSDLARSFMEEKINSYCNIVKDMDNPLEKLLFVHDRIVLDCIYDTEAADIAGNLGAEEILPEEYHKSFHAYGLLQDGTAVCQGYAQVLYMVAKELGFEVSYCYNSGHIWNYIKVNGKWYHMDVTWDDPTNMDQASVWHQYFLCSDTMMQQKGHGTVWETSEATAPVCESEKYEKDHIFNTGLPFVTEKRGDYIGFTAGSNFFCAKQPWVGDFITTQPKNGAIKYLYIQEPVTGRDVYITYRNEENKITFLDIKNLEWESMVNASGQIKIYTFAVPTPPQENTGIIYFWKTGTVTPMSSTLLLN